MKTCYIFGAAQGLPDGFYKGEDDLVIAADAGLLHLEKIGIAPDITVGDFDSLGSLPNEGEVIKFPVKKDDTDTLLAVKIGFEKGYSNFIIYGGTGGRRLDHTIANLQTLNYVAEKKGRAYLCGDGFCVTAVTNGSIAFKPSAKGTVSVFSACGKTTGVNIKGLLYSLENGELSSAIPLGVSNEFIGERSEISVENGTVTVFWSGSICDLV